MKNGNCPAKVKETKTEKVTVLGDRKACEQETRNIAKTKPFEKRGGAR